MNRCDYRIHGRRLAVVARDAATAGVLDEVFASHRAPAGPEEPDLHLEIAHGLATERPARGESLGVAADGTRFSAADAGGVVIDTDGVGWAWVEPEGGRGRVHLGDGTEAEAWQQAYRLLDPVVVELLKARGLYSVHAGAVADGGDAMLLCGASGSGKSTLSLAMARRGWGFLSDDTCYLDGRAGEGAPVVGARWSPLHLTDATLEALLPPASRERAERRSGSGKWFVPVHAVEGLVPVESARVRWVVFPEIHDADASICEELSPSAAMRLLLKQSLVPSDRSTSQRQFDALASVCATVSSYRLRLGADLVEATDRLRALAADRTGGGTATRL